MRAFSENIARCQLAIADTGGIVVAVDNGKRRGAEYGMMETAKEVLPIFSSFGISPEMFRSDMQSKEELAMARALAFLTLVVEAVRKERGEKVEVGYLIEREKGSVGYVIVPLIPLIDSAK